MRDTEWLDVLKALLQTLFTTLRYLTHVIHGEWSGSLKRQPS